MDADPVSIILKLLVLLALILINAFFAMSEIAIISLNDNKIEKMAEEGNKKAKQVLRLTKDSSGFLSTIQIGVTLAGFLTSATASQSFAVLITEKLSATNVVNVIPKGVISVISTVLITVIMSYFSLVLGELAPKKIAMHSPQKVSFTVVSVLLFVNKTAKPFVKLLSASTNGLVRLFGIDPNEDEEVVTEEEIRMMVDVGQEKGVIEDVQKEMINNIFEFDDMDVAAIMTHRTDMDCVEFDDPLSEIIDMAVECGHSRIPVYKEDQDNIVGVLYVKDFLKYIGTSIPKSKSIKDFLRDTYYVPKTKKCSELLSEMLEKRVQLAVVVDEYGGTSGIVTLEDVLESIVGNIQDEYDDEDEEISQIDDTTFTVDGVTFIDDIEDRLPIKIPDGDYDTLGGFIISLLGYLPTGEKQDVVTFKNIKFTVLGVEDRRIGKVRVEILPSQENENDE